MASDRARELQKGAEEQAAHLIAQREKAHGLLRRIVRFASDEWEHEQPEKLAPLLAEIEAELGESLLWP